MFKALQQLKYGMRVLLSKGGGQPETIEVAGRKTTIMHGGEGPPLVYLHSTLGESFMWLPFYQGLANHFHVYVPTHPGFHQSEGFDQIDTIEDMAFHYVELFDALGFEEPVMVGGVSLGGWIAAEIAVRWPERISKLWIADAPGLWVEGVQLGDLFRHIQSRKKMREMLFFDPQGPLASLVIKDNPDEAAMMTGYQHMTVLARLVWERPYDAKLASRLHRVQCPVLLLWGEHDKLVPPAFGKAYQQYLPQAEMKLIPRCGHLPMFEAEKEFVEALVQFGKR